MHRRAASTVRCNRLHPWRVRQHAECCAQNAFCVLVTPVGVRAHLLERSACFSLAKAEGTQRAKRLRMGLGNAGIHGGPISSAVRCTTGGELTASAFASRSMWARGCFTGEACSTSEASPTSEVRSTWEPWRPTSAVAEAGDGMRPRCCASQQAISTMSEPPGEQRQESRLRVHEGGAQLPLLVWGFIYLIRWLASSKDRNTQGDARQRKRRNGWTLRWPFESTTPPLNAWRRWRRFGGLAQRGAIAGIVMRLGLEIIERDPTILLNTGTE
jgi:hypothetical protein